MDSLQPETAKPPGAPVVLGRYTLLDRIAMGGMGEVYLARGGGAQGLHKQLVIKKILPHLASDPAFVQRFLDEARLVVGLSHSNIVQVFDVGEAGGEYFLAMEHVDGCDLRELLRRARASHAAVPMELALFIASEICEGLGYVHSLRDPDGRRRGIIHRDVSPSNVLVSRSGEVKLTDFGVAKARSKTSRSVTGSVHGKFQYMSPEQAAGNELDARSDLFALGTVLYEMLAGKRPFEGATDLATLERVRKVDCVPLRTLRPNLPDTVLRLVEWCHQRSRKDRPESAYAVASEIQRVLAGIGVPVGRRDVAQFTTGLLDDARLAPISLDAAIAMQLGPGVGGSQGQTATAGVSSVFPAADHTGSVPAEAAAPAAVPAKEDGDRGRAASPPVTATNSSAISTGSQVVITSPRSYRLLQIAVGVMALVVILLVVVNLTLFRRTSDMQALPGAPAVVSSVPEQPVKPPAEPPADPGELPGTSESDDPEGFELAAEPPVQQDLTAAPAARPLAHVEVRPRRLPSLTFAASAESDSTPTGTPRTAPTSRAVTVRAKPATALISVAGDVPRAGSRQVEVKPRDRIAVSATLDGHEPASATLRYDGARNVVLELAPSAMQGEVYFRFWPASATVYLDGKRIRTGDDNVVQAKLPAGPHRVRLVAEDGSFDYAEEFVVAPGEVKRLGELKPR